MASRTLLAATLALGLTGLAQAQSAPPARQAPEQGAPATQVSPMQVSPRQASPTQASPMQGTETEGDMGARRGPIRVGPQDSRRDARGDQRMRDDRETRGEREERREARAERPRSRARAERRPSEYRAARYQGGRGATWKTGPDSHGFGGTFGGCTFRGHAGPNGYRLDRSC